jgi:hypothetical protein
MRSRRKNWAPWAMIEPGDPSYLICTRCEAREQVHLPLPVPKFTKQTDAFVRAHSQCQERDQAANTEKRSS